MAKPNANKFTSSQGEQSTNINGIRSNRKLFENDAYESFSQGLFATARSCHQTNADTSATQRKMLETFHANLMHLHQHIDDKLSKK